MIRLKKTRISKAEKKRRDRVLFWAVFVIIINLLQLLFKNWLTNLIAMVGTIYALYKLVVYDNPKNRFSQRFYDWKGKRISK
ncbi:hypothetical protein [Lactobacillus sp. ESL0681]|uniref:hypothetical protein n=1 Tax=Lactobacillus sp. ESL0681 TaxID=2983211 RepID=UPI0023F98A9D|nr:hypothetical protein [Lactobacillus sp. ESL0681]WEV40138.1 hypothetical protein OZX59_07990 [Lactobacillus sp. ESL0681]